MDRIADTTADVNWPEQGIIHPLRSAGLDRGYNWFSGL
jgi:hypothetical protein